MSDAIRDLDDLARVVGEEVGVRLLTVLHWLPEERTLRRLFTNQPGDYPVGGTKTVEVSADWLASTVQDHRAVLGPDLASVRATFADHETIERLGCGSFLTVPLLVGTDVAVLCLLDAEHHYDQDSLQAVLSLQPAAERAVGARLEEDM